MSKKFVKSRLPATSYNSKLTKENMHQQPYVNDGLSASQANSRYKQGPNQGLNPGPNHLTTIHS